MNRTINLIRAFLTALINEGSALVRRMLRLTVETPSVPHAYDDQLMADAGVEIKPRLLGQSVKSVDTPMFQSQSGVDSATIDPTAFAETQVNHGVFGIWTLDRFKLPTYLYKLDQYRDRLAHFVNSQGLDRRDHWHQLGNDHVTALAGNDGIVQVYIGDRGGIFLNHYAPEEDTPRTLMGFFNFFILRIIRFYWRVRAAYFRWRMRDKIVPRSSDNPLAPKTQESLDAEAEYAYGGGYSYLADSSEAWATAHRYAPLGAKTHRVFGMGYFETETLHRNIRHHRRIYAPYGDHPVLLSDIEIENTGTETVNLRCYEYWDVNIHQLRVQWVRSGVLATRGDKERIVINSRFRPVVEPELDGQALHFRQERFADPPIKDDEMAGFVDSNPPHVFLANLSGETLPASDYYTDKAAFFGKSSEKALTPEAVRSGIAGKTDNANEDDSMPYCLVLRHDLRLAPNEKKKLRFAYGALPRPEQSLAFLNEFTQDVDPLDQTMKAWKKQLAYFSNGRSKALQWEMSWHTYNLLSATLYSDFYDTHYIPQGSAYLYLHGADGAPRDQALFTLPLTYIRPSLAKEVLILLLRLRNEATTSMPYSFVGNGAHDNAHTLHAKPSDLDLFFLLAMAEYLAATGDSAFLQETVPLYKQGKPPTEGTAITVLAHIQMAFRNLEAFGLGAHDLLVIGTGDWDDSIVAGRIIDPRFDRSRSINQGESVPNSQMALYVLPLIAAVIAHHNPTLAQQMQALAQTLKEAVKKQWNTDKKWFYRAWLWERGDVNDLVGDNTLSLQSQVWPLISGLAKEMGVETDLIATITKQLDDDNPTGAMLEVKGQIWPAVSQLLTWGYQRSRPDLAWRSLNRQTFSMHATIFPSVWFNIWTGPDGTNSHQMVNPGGTWASPVTPMTDLPGMNANQDAMALLGLLRVCGIEPSRSGDGLDLAPKAPVDCYKLHTELLHLEVSPQHIIGEYCAANDGKIVLHIHVPPTVITPTVLLNGQSFVNSSVVNGRVDVPLQFIKGQKIPFEVRWE